MTSKPVPTTENPDHGSSMQVDSPPHLDNDPSPTKTAPQTEDVDVDMSGGKDVNKDTGVSAGSKEGTKESEAEASFKKGTANFFKARQGRTNANANDKGKGKEALLDDPISAREGMPWVEKYRPDTLADVVSHQDITGTSKSLTTRRTRRRSCSSTFRPPILVLAFFPLFFPSLSLLHLHACPGVYSLTTSHLPTSTSYPQPVALYSSNAPPPHFTISPHTVENFIQKGRLPHLLFYGPPGTGKTSTILAIARRIYGAKTYKSHILELNASDDRGIDVVREQIKGFAQTRVLFR